VSWLGNAVLALIALMLLRYAHGAIIAIVALAWFATIRVWIWVGLWRSAGRHSRVWSGLVRLSIVLAVLKYASKVAGVNG
jgi:hypothetical protein